VLVLLLLYAATSLPWLIVTPPFDAPDEIAHYDYARYIAATGHLPDHVPTALREGDWYLTHWPQPPLYYVLVSQAVRAVHAEAVSPLTFLEFDLAEQHGPSARRVIIREPGERAATRALFLGRLVSWTFGAGLIVALFAALGAAGASDRARVMLIASLVLVPAFTSNLVAVNNDSLAACVAAATAAVMFCIVARPEARGLSAWLGLGALLGLALSSKSTTSFLVPMAVVSCLTGARAGVGAGTGARWSARVASARLAAVAVGAMPCLGFTAARNWMTFGDPFASSLTAVLSRFHPPPPTWSLTSPDLYIELSRSLFTGFTAQFGWAGVMPRSAAIWWLYITLLIAVIVLSAIAAIALGGLGRSRDTPAAVRLTRVAATGVIVHLASLYVVNGVVMFAASGRHLLPVVAPALVLVYCGAAIVARAIHARGLSLVTRAVPAAVLTLLAAAWVAVFVELTLRFRYGG
jgi:hypothetical protein